MLTRRGRRVLHEFTDAVLFTPDVLSLISESLGRWNARVLARVCIEWRNFVAMHQATQWNVLHPLPRSLTLAVPQACDYPAMLDGELLLGQVTANDMHIAATLQGDGTIHHSRQLLPNRGNLLSLTATASAVYVVLEHSLLRVPVELLVPAARASGSSTPQEISLPERCSPSGCAAFEEANSDLVVLADAACDRIIRFSFSSTQISMLPAFGREHLKAPFGLAVARTAQSNGIEVFVADGAHHRICVFSGQGSHVRSFGKHGTRPGEFRWPMGVAVTQVDSGPLIYVAEDYGRRLQVLSLLGAPLQVIFMPCRLGGICASASHVHVKPLNKNQELIRFAKR